MQDLKLFNTNITMSSVEISELTGKRHDHVMTDITKLLTELNLNAPDFTGTQKYGNNNTRNIYSLPRRECDILMMGYSTEMRAKVYDRWQELEHMRLNPYMNLTKRELFLLAAEQEEKIEYLEQFKETVDNSKVIFSKKESVYDKEKGYKKDVKHLYPFLNNTNISMILNYYTTTKYKDTDHYIKDELSCVATFFTEADMKVSTTKDTVIIKHPCLLGNRITVRKDKAIEYLDYVEEEFE
jgi:phage regulator Rha-like protein